MSSSHLINETNLIVIHYLDPSTSAQLLSKFPDTSALGFDYSKSALWSPQPVRRFNPVVQSKCVSPRTPKTKGKKKGGEMGVFKKLTLSRVKGKFAAVKMNLNLSKNKTGCRKDSDGLESSRSPKGKGWGKALKARSKEFKKKKDIPAHIKLSNYLCSKDF
ncbi:hypothetical protein Droror1_Dr00004720 [Drosera rotundifolia]